jgi:hypothetical protein
MSDFPEMVYKATEPDEVLPEVDAHGYVQGVYRGTIQPNGSRLKAAIAALPFERPKLAVTAITSTEDLATRLEAAIAATGKVIDGRPAQVLPPPKPVETPQVVEPLDHSKPFAVDNKSRWRRF